MGKNKSNKMSKEFIDDLRREVNSFDKEFGVKLKKINPKAEPEMVFKSFTDSFKIYLYKVLCEINGIEPIIYEDGEVYSFGNKEFTDLSLLEWGKDNYYGVNSYIYRCRFLTVFLTEYIEKIDKIALKKYDYLSLFKTGKYENAYFYMKRLTDDTRRFIKVMLSGGPYGNIFLKMNNNCNFIRTKKTDPRELNKYIIDIRHELKIGLSHTLLKPAEMPEDIAIYSILQLAYLICTGETSIDELPNFRDVEGADTSYELRGLTEALGAAILESRKFRKRPILYLAFNRANPSFSSRYQDINENWFISVGVRALEYTKFFCNDKYITKFINKML